MFSVSNFLLAEKHRIYYFLNNLQLSKAVKLFKGLRLSVQYIMLSFLNIQFGFIIDIPHLAGVREDEDGE